MSSRLQMTHTWKALFLPQKDCLKFANPDNATAISGRQQNRLCSWSRTDGAVPSPCVNQSNISQSLVSVSKRNQKKADTLKKYDHLHTSWKKHMLVLPVLVCRCGAIELAGGWKLANGQIGQEKGNRKVIWKRMQSDSQQWLMLLALRDDKAAVCV